MLNLKDTTFIIPVRIDTQERLRNITTVLKYLTKYFDTNIIVMEEAATSVVGQVIGNTFPSVQYVFNNTNNPLLHRTRMLNDMVKLSQTPYFINHDTDILVAPMQYYTAIATLRNNQLDMVYPYNGKFIDIMGDALNGVLSTLTLDGLKETSGNLIHPNSLGGAVAYSKQTFIKVGMECEYCVSWGWEDNIRLNVAQKMGLRIGRIDGCLFHMYHPPSLNSANADHPAYKNNEAEYHKIVAMNPHQLQHYISLWPWVPK